MCRILLSLSDMVVEYYMNEMVERFYTTGHDSSGISTSWDELRGVILQEGLTMYLQPMALKYCRKKLTEHSHRVIIQEASKKLWDLGTYGCVKCAGEDGSIVACVVGEHQEPTFCCVLDPQGSVIKHLTLHFLKCNISKGTGKGRDPTQRGLVQRKYLDTRTFNCS